MIESNSYIYNYTYVIIYLKKILRGEEGSFGNRKKIASLFTRVRNLEYYAQ